MIAIIDYDAGNIKSVEKAVQYLGEEAVITRASARAAAIIFFMVIPPVIPG